MPQISSLLIVFSDAVDSIFKSEGVSLDKLALTPQYRDYFYTRHYPHRPGYHCNNNILLLLLSPQSIINMSGEDINLYNFEEPSCENSRYVLTSPRSLEACARLGVKPLELLHKPYSEFEEQLQAIGRPKPFVLAMFEENEKQRLEKLKKCRDERSSIIRSQSAGTKNLTRWQKNAISKDDINHMRKRESHSQGEQQRPISAKKTTSAEDLSRPSVRFGQTTTIRNEDYKILKALKGKHESERLAEMRRAKIRTAWEDEKETALDNEVLNEIDRRERLGGNIDIWKKQKVKLNMSQTQSANQLHLEQSRHIQQKDSQWKRLAAIQQNIKQLNSEKQMYERFTRSTRQISNKKSIDDCDNQFRSAVAQKTSLAMRRAEGSRDELIQRESYNKMLKSYETKLRHEKRKLQLDEQNRLEAEMLKLSVEKKHNEGMDRAQLQQLIRDNEIKLNVLRKEEKIYRSKVSNDEQDKVRRDLADATTMKHQMDATRIQRVMSGVSELKSDKVRMARLIRQKEQQKNLERVKEDEMMWRRTLKDDLEFKDQKGQLIQHERDMAIEKSRALSKAAEDLRSRIHGDYDRDSFNKKALQVTLEAQVGKGPLKSTKNETTFKFG